MGKITFILGGTRSGKSKYAVNLANKYKRVGFIATCMPLDKEMKKRISHHKASRPKNWKTFENYLNLEAVLKQNAFDFDIFIIDCLTLMVSNLLFKGMKEKIIEDKIKSLFGVLKKIKTNSIIVSNEVGLGIVPSNKLARDFRDVAGRINQIAAEKADNVFLMVSGLPCRMK